MTTAKYNKNICYKTFLLHLAIIESVNCDGFKG